VHPTSTPTLIRRQIANPSVAALYEDALVYETGSAITASGALSAYSGAKTGRSPSDKRIVEEDSSKDDVWWGPVNKPMKTDVSLLRIFPNALPYCLRQTAVLACEILAADVMYA
jgi:ATP-dependent phosphoenolpyruvate carboxykinase